MLRCGYTIREVYGKELSIETKEHREHSFDEGRLLFQSFAELINASGSLFRKTRRIRIQ
jgi:hypothetical protein